MAARTVRTVWMTAIVLLVFAVAAAIIFRAGDALLLIFAGVLAGILLRAPSVWFAQKLGVREGVGLAITLVLLLGGLGATAVFFAAEIARQFSELGTRLPELIQQAQDRAISIFPGDSFAATGDLAQSPEAQQRLLNRALGVASTALGAAASVVIIAFIGLYLAVDPEMYRRGILALVPPARRKRFDQLITEVVQTLRLWLLGKLFTMSIVGVLVGVSLSLLGIPLALGLGIIAALLDFIPNIGPILAAVPALLLATTQGGEMVLYVGGLYLAVQLLEGYVLDPLVQKHNINLAPAFTISAQVVIAVFFGILGVALVTPLIAAGMVVTRMLYIDDILGGSAHQDAPEAKPPDAHTEEPYEESRAANLG